jgi:hypothetical protein
MPPSSRSRFRPRHIRKKTHARTRQLRAGSRSRSRHGRGRGSNINLPAAAAAALGVAGAAYLWNTKQNRGEGPLLSLPKNQQQLTELRMKFKDMSDTDYVQKRQEEKLPCNKNLYLRFLNYLNKEKDDLVILHDMANNFFRWQKMSRNKQLIWLSSIIHEVFIQVTTRKEFEKLIDDPDPRLAPLFKKIKASNVEKSEISEEDLLFTQKYLLLEIQRDVKVKGDFIPDSHNVKLLRDAIERTFFQCPSSSS